MAKLDLVGQKFGRWSVIERASRPAHIKQRGSYFVCQCECGNKTVIRGNQLVYGTTKSCGCLKMEHLQQANCHDDPKQSEFATARFVFRDNEYNDGDLTFDQFYSLTQQPCYYCNVLSSLSNSRNIFKTISNNNRPASQFAIEHGTFYFNGLDRISSNVPHNVDNVVPCCKTCNSFKLDLSISQFIQNIQYLNYNPILLTSKDLHFVSDILHKYGMTKLSQIYTNKVPSGTHIITIRRGRAKKNADERGFDFTLSHREIEELICAPCVYCNRTFDPSIDYYNSIDRIDSNVGYISDNCVSCCKYCNTAKNNLTLEQFFQWIKRIKDYYPILLEKVSDDERFKNAI